MTQFNQRYQRVETQYNADQITIQQQPLSLTEKQRKQNRTRMLDRVQAIWIDGVLEPSIQGAAQIALELQHKPSAVLTPMWHVLREFSKTGPLPPADASIVQVYDHANGEVLILGEPGAGKTTLLLELTRDLLDRARQDEAHPIPVVFPLSSWATTRQPLTQWLASELHTRYQVPRPLAATWIATDQVLPLLDGLDEVEAPHRAACVEAINAYRQAHGLLPAVVCSRQTDYFALPTRTLLRTVVIVQPLSPQQIETYLTSAGEPLVALHQALQEDADLQTLASTPLMLTILTQAYRGTPLSEIAPLGTLPAKQQQVFATYVKRMLTRRGPLKAGTDQQVVQWLTFLATRMREHNQTVFYLEQLQPDWLVPEDKCMYRRLGVLLPGILIGMLTGLILSTFQGSVAGPTQLIIFSVLGGFLGGLYSGDAFRRVSPSEPQSVHPKPERRRHIVGQVVISTLIGLLLALSFGLSLGKQFGFGDWLRQGGIFGVTAGLGCLFLQLLFSFATPRTLSSNASSTRRWEHLVQTVHGQRALRTISVMGLVGGLSSWLIAGQLSRLATELLYFGVSFGLISVLVSLILDVQAEGVYLAERLRWTWNSLMKSLLMPKHMRISLLLATIIGVITCLSFGLIVSPNIGLSTGLSTGLSSGLFYWSLLGLFQGVSSEQIEEQLRQIPNQGLQRTLHNCMLMGIISGGVIWLISILSDGLGYGLFYGLNRVQGVKPPGGIEGLGLWLTMGLSTGLNVGLFLGLCGGLLACAMSGGLAALRHGILRLLLRRAGVVPRHYVRFLDEAASCILLRKVGGGYNYIHRLLLDYFADLEKKDRK